MQQSSSLSSATERSVRSVRIATDVGGTFTDIVAFDERTGEILHGKTLTTPHKLVDGIVSGVLKAGVGTDHTRLFLHGTTIAINTIMERSGARTALLTTRGFRDVYEIGRINRPQAYNLFFRKHQPLIPRSRRYEIDERIGASGEILQPLDDAQIRAVAEELRRQDVAAVAILFFHSYRNPEHELRARQLLQQLCPGMYVCASHELSQEYREYERTSTVAANAYIGPRINTYLGEIEDRLRREKLHGPFFVVQSNGGLFDAARAQRECVRMLESGPAAGVVGAQAICARLGLANAIAFDMGGTTAKAGVVYGGEPMMAGNIMVGGYEEGLPIQMPLIDIQEVGTGGGSIAYIESGGGLRVGPQSSGAVPGPVCYDLGGEQPTVTDANLILGRLSRDNFLGGEMPLNPDKAERSLKQNVADPLQLSLTDAANGIIRIACTSMAQVVTRVTTERGLDAGDFAMVAYGGAGPLHACLVARELNIPTVIIPPSPGHFSAYGMLMADLRRDFVRTWFRPVATLEFAEMEALYAQMEDAGRQDVQPHMNTAGQITSTRSADMRYVNQEHSVTVELPASLFQARDRAALKQHFDQEHMKRYGFNSPRDPAEVVSLYSSVVGRLDKPRSRPIAAGKAGNKPEAASIRPVFFTESKGFADTPIYNRDDLARGDRIAGPALIEEYASTTVLPPGDRLEVGEFGDLIITIARQQAAQDTGSAVETARADDPVITEIVRNSVVAITEEMKSNLMRTACSMIIYEAQDFTVGLFDAQGNTVSIGIGLPMFVHGMSYTVKAMLGHFGVAGMAPGDVLITNDAYITGSHLNHVTLSVPIFHDGVLVGFSACMAHWADIGAALNIVTRDIYSEGLQLPMLKMYRAGAINEDLLEILRMNVRIPERAMGDLQAQIAAVKTGAKRFLELIARYTRPAVLNGIVAIMDRSEVQARQQVATIPDGVYEGESYMDDDAVDQGQRVPIRVKVIVKGEQMTVDLSNVSLQVKGFYNSGESAGISCCQVAFKCITSPMEKPINEGSFRALNVILPKGTIVSAVKPAPMMKWMTYPMTVADTIFKTLARAIPERVIAGHHADLMSVHINGKMPKDGRLFIVNGGLIGGGWGATSQGDGSHVTICINDGDTHNSPLEQLEAKYPMIVERYALREDSGGAGRHQGGLGAEFVCRAAGEFMFNAGVERVHCRPWGLFDGHPGAGNEVGVRLGKDEELRFPSGKVYGRQLTPGDAYILRSGGGGGYGSPLERSLEQIAFDLREGYISRQRAEGCYGVCFDEQGRIDAAATEAKRAELRASGEFSARLARLAAEGIIEPDAAPVEKLLTQGRLFPLRCC